MLLICLLKRRLGKEARSAMDPDMQVAEKPLANGGKESAGKEFNLIEQKYVSLNALA